MNEIIRTPEQIRRALAHHFRTNWMAHDLHRQRSPQERKDFTRRYIAEVTMIEARPKRFVVVLSGTRSCDPISQRKIVEAPCKSQARQIALRTWTKATSASVEGVQQRGKWRACETLSWEKGQQILKGKKPWDL